MTQETKRKWLPVLALFLPLATGVLGYALANERRLTIHEERIASQGEQIREIKTMLDDNYEDLKRIVEQQRIENKQDHQRISDKIDELK